MGGRKASSSNRRVLLLGCIFERVECRGQIVAHGFPSVPPLHASLLVLAQLAIERVRGHVDGPVHVRRFILANDRGALEIGHHLDAVAVLDLYSIVGAVGAGASHETVEQEKLKVVRLAKSGN